MTNFPTQPALGWWHANGTAPASGEAALGAAIRAIHHPVALVEADGQLAVARNGLAVMGPAAMALAVMGPAARPGSHPLVGYAAACPIEHLGDPGFREELGLARCFVAGAMANGIGSAEIVEAMGRAGMLGFFGAAGLPLERIESAIDRIQQRLAGRPYGFNLIHSPNEPELEAAVVDLYLRRGVRLAEASAYLDLTLPVVRYRVHGIHRDGAGRIITPNRLIAKVSRVEVASKFFSPPPDKLLAELIRSGDLSPQQAELAARIPMAQDLTAEADSGGHTDNRPAMALLPTMIALRDRMQASYGYEVPLRVGAAGGIGTPASAAAAFAMGAAYVLTGSINQASVEAGTSDLVRRMLAEAQQADVAMAPAADMFEMGVRVQVLKRGTMFPMRASKLYEIYRSRAGLEAIAPDERAMLEKQIFRAPLEEIWEETRRYFVARAPSQVERAERDPKHKMALVFRWYLGQSSRWANAGRADRQVDFQIWCGPAMGAFNEWVRGTVLEPPANRSVVTMALNILYGAAVLVRANTLRCQGIRLPAEAFQIVPKELAELERCLQPPPKDEKGDRSNLPQPFAARRASGPAGPAGCCAPIGPVPFFGGADPGVPT